VENDLGPEFFKKNVLEFTLMVFREERRMKAKGKGEA
jgi:hypothetical protein